MPREDQRQWGYSDEQRKRDVVAAIRAHAAAGGALTVREVGGTYSAARRAFGSWDNALKAAGFEGGVESAGSHENLKHLDAISPWQLEGLPPFLRQRQLLGGALLETLAKYCSKEGKVSVTQVSAVMLVDGWHAMLDSAEETLLDA